MDHSVFIVLGIAFWAFLAISAVAGIVSDYKKRRLELEPLRAAIERGQQLDPAIVERLMMREHPDKTSELEPVHFRIGGIVTTAAGLGIAVLSFIIQSVAPKILFLLGLGTGSVAVCVGVGLLICARVVERARGTRTTPEAGA
jgi:hypothetical protein